MSDAAYTSATEPTPRSTSRRSTRSTKWRTTNAEVYDAQNRGQCLRKIVDAVDERIRGCLVPERVERG